jgi:hypothetical protein
VATHQDLSGLFLVRSVEFYLKPVGHFSLVMPLAALSRRQFAGLRTGSYATATGEVAVAFDIPWDLHRVKPNLFRVPPSVISGRHAEEPTGLPPDAECWRGRLPGRNLSWPAAEAHITRARGEIAVARHAPVSSYHARFTQGATLAPRCLLMVEDAPASPIGVAAGRRAVRSRRSANEKPPWKDLPALEGSVEDEFVRPVHLGATLLPFRLLEPWLGIIPWDGSRLFDGSDPHLDLYPGLADWWTRAESLWDVNKGESDLTLLERADYRKGLALQLPAAAHRVLYTGSGRYLAAARIDDSRPIADTKLYWAATETPEEARYLTAVLNCRAITQRLAPMQSRGEHNPRDFHRLVWRLPIPLFDPDNELHQQLVILAEQAEAVAASVDVSAHRTFQAQRRLIREGLERAGIASAMDEAVSALVPRAG